MIFCITPNKREQEKTAWQIEESYCGTLAIGILDVMNRLTAIQLAL
jgi:hypothetical protein